MTIVTSTARVRLFSLLLALTLIAVATTFGASRGSATAPFHNVTTYDFTNSRSGNDPSRPAISGLSAAATWRAKLDGAVYGQPLVVNGQVLVATENDSLYALAVTSGRVIWHAHVGTAVSTTIIDQAPSLNGFCGDINPLGITGTPVVDLALNEVFVAAETMIGPPRWQGIRHELVAISLRTHKVVWQRIIDPPGGNMLSASNGYTIPAEQQRSALSLANGRVYVSFGGLAGDCGTYHGFVVGLNVAGRGATLSYQVPSATEGAIWATGGAVISAQGNLYVATGNGNSITTYDGGDSVVELSPTLTVLSIWAPTDWADLAAADADLGSAGPILVPGTSEIFIAGKKFNGSFGYLLPAGNVGHGPGPAAFKGNVCASATSSVFGADASDIVTTGAVSTTYIYTPCGNGIEALTYTGGASPSFARAWTASTGHPKGPPIVAGGLVWSLDWSNSVLYAMSPTTGHVSVIRATAPLNHFASPMVTTGFVLLPTRDGVQAFATTP